MPVSTIERPNEALATNPKERRNDQKKLTTTAATAVRVQPAQVVQETRAGFFSRADRALHDAAFQLGLTGPARLYWYRDSHQLSAKEKTELDARMMGFFH